MRTIEDMRVEETRGEELSRDEVFKRTHCLIIIN